MSIKTNLHGRLRNTPLAVRHGLMPLFEAVVNSIHAIEEADRTASGQIRVEIVRSPQGHLALASLSNADESRIGRDIIGFTVCDNGIGFNDENMKSFETLDTEHKINKGGRGVGRLLWLKAFSKVNVESTFKKNGTVVHRAFQFDARSGVSDPEDAVLQDGTESTCVHLDGFDRKYQESTSKTIGAISNSLLEHCLWYFVRKGGAPHIIIRDGEEFVELDNLFAGHMHHSAVVEKAQIKSRLFELTHIKFRASSGKNHSLAYCAANRLVTEENISGKIPGLFGKLSDDAGEFVYSCYVSSDFLDEHVRAERTGFDMAEQADGMFSETEIAFQDIRNVVLERAREHLANYLEVNIFQGKNRLEEFVSKKAPRYRPILARIPEKDLIIDPNISDKDLDITLHKHLADIERRLLESGHEIMTPKAGEELMEYQARLREYLQTAEDIKKSDLANYVSHRRVILDLLTVAIQRNQDGKYAREELIHELIMPMRKESNEVLLDSCNLWLIDERLAFHNYLASDKALSSMPITGSQEIKEPDICGLNVCDNPILVSEGKRLPLASIVVVEIKRPMRNDARVGEEKDPIEQVLGYLNRIRKGKVTTASGRLIPNSEDIPGYCYVVCDLTESVENRCRLLDLTVTSDHLGYFGFHKQYKSYIEVLSFDRLVNSAVERNRAFFDKLGLPTT